MAVLSAQIESLSEATKEASADLQKRRSSLDTRSSRLIEEKESRQKKYNELQQHLADLWEARRVPLSERVDFLIQADEMSNYSKSVLELYDHQINVLERSTNFCRYQET